MATAALQDNAANDNALALFEAMTQRDIVPILAILDDPHKSGLAEVKDMTIDGTPTFLTRDGHFETAINLYWKWGCGVVDERSGIATGRLVEGMPVIDSIVVHSLVN